MSYTVNFNQDGTKIIAGAAFQKEIVIIDTITGDIIKRIKTTHSDYIKHTAFVNNDTLVSCGGDKDCMIKFWDADSGDEIKTLKGQTKGISSIDLSRDGSRIVSSSWDKTIRIWDLNENKNNRYRTLIEGGANKIEAVVISSNRKYCVFSSRDGSSNLWNIEKRQLIQVLQGHSKPVKCVAFSNDSEIIATGSSDNTIIVWKASTGTLLKTIPVGVHVGSIIFNPINPNIVIWSSGIDKSIHILDIENTKEIGILKGHKGFIYALAISPDGRTIASGSNDNTIRIWDIASCKQIGLPTNLPSTIYSLSFSQNGNYIISGSGDNDNCIRLWQITHESVSNQEALQYCGTMKGHIDNVRFVTFANDKSHNYIVSASSDKCIKIWDTVYFKEVATLHGHTNRILNVSLSYHNSHLSQIISASADGSVRIWDFPPLQDLIDQTQDRFKDRPLTAEERKMYYLE